MSSTPRTPRRPGTAHEPTADLVTQRADVIFSQNLIESLYPEYWSEYRHDRKALLSPPSTVCEADLPSSCRRSPWSVAPPRIPMAPRASSGGGDFLAHETLEKADRVLHHRPRGFDMSRSSPRGSVSGITLEAPADLPTTLDVKLKAKSTSSGLWCGVEFSRQVTRRQAQFAQGTCECPSVCAYRDRLPHGTFRSRADEEHYYETFVDEQDQRFTAGTTSTTAQRARVVMRKRSVQPNATSAARGEATPTPVFNQFDRMLGRERAGEERHRQSVRSADVTCDSPGRPVSAATGKVGGVAVDMVRTTGRGAPISTVLPHSTPKAVCEGGFSRATPHAAAAHVPTPRLGGGTPRWRKPIDSGPKGGMLAYHVNDALVTPRAPSASL